MIVVDVQAVQSAAHGERGIARYVGELARTLATEHPDLVDVFAWNDRLPYVGRLDELGLGDRLRPFSELRDRAVDVLHIGSPFEMLDVDVFAPPVRARRTVVTCYDLIPYRFPERYLTETRTAVRYRSRLALLSAADAVVTDSRSAADDVERLLGVSPGRVTVIGAGVSERFRAPDRTPDELFESLRAVVPALEPGFVLVPAGIDWRKNVDGTIAAYAALPFEIRADHQLVLACRVADAERERLFDLAGALGVADRLVITGYVDDATLVELYQACELVLFASKYEGFGLPVLEARRCGARVICSDVSSLPEVLTDERATFNPWVPDEITATLALALTDDDFRAVLDAVPDVEFEWSRTARRLAGVLEHQRSAALGAPAPSTRRLAVVTPLPPTPSGIANHSDRLLSEMAAIDGVEVSAFVTRDASRYEGERPFAVHDLSTLPTQWVMGEFDRVLYCLGNHELHRPFVSSLRLVPGALFLHDVRLQGLFDTGRVDVNAVAQTADGRPSELWSASIIAAATDVLVQSQHAADLVLDDAGVVAKLVGPHHCHTPALADGAVPDDGLPWVVTAGIADRSKLTHRFVDAADQLVAAGVARAAVVGLGGEAFVPDDSEVVATGPVGEGEYGRWLASAAVVVQLRGASNGESSGVVAEALALGRPLVVSDVGAMAELPDDVAVKVAADVSASELAAVVSELLADETRRTEMGSAALAFASEHTASRQAHAIVDALFSD